MVFVLFCLKKKQLDIIRLTGWLFNNKTGFIQMLYTSVSHCIVLAFVPVSSQDTYQLNVYEQHNNNWCSYTNGVAHAHYLDPRDLN